MSTDVISRNDCRKEKPPSSAYRIELGELTPHNIKQFRLINQVVFPVSYSEKFYADILKNCHMCRLAYFNDIVVGGVSYRIENVPVKTEGTAPESQTNQTVKKCYIMTLGCLAHYRNLGIGTAMLKHVVKFCVKLGYIKSIYLHVHVENDVALNFYKRYGFEITGEVPGYYRCVTPQTAYALEKVLTSEDSREDFSDSE